MTGRICSPPSPATVRRGAQLSKAENPFPDEQRPAPRPILARARQARVHPRGRGCKPGLDMYSILYI